MRECSWLYYQRHALIALAISSSQLAMDRRTIPGQELCVVMSKSSKDTNLPSLFHIMQGLRKEWGYFVFALLVGCCVHLLHPSRSACVETRNCENAVQGVFAVSCASRCARPQQAARSAVICVGYDYASTSSLTGWCSQNESRMQPATKTASATSRATIPTQKCRQR